VLEATYQQYLRQASLQTANDRISNAIAGLPIFLRYPALVRAALRAAFHRHGRATEGAVKRRRSGAV